MESDPVSYIYSRYKSGTKVVVNWLVETAHQQLDILKELGIPPPNGKNTNQHRTGKKARNKKASVEKISRNVALSSNDLLRISSKVAASASPNTPAPAGLDNVLNILDDVIRGRQECALWHARGGDSGHRHFLDTLKQVLRHLKEAPWQHRKPSGKSQKAPELKSDHHTTDSITNTFASLSIEQPGPSPLGVGQVSKQVSTKDKLPSNVSFQIETDPEEEGLFAAWCFFKECKSIRTALIIDAFKRFADEFGDLSSYDNMAQVLELTTDIRDGQVERFSCLSPTSSKGKARSQDMMDVLCVKAFIGAAMVREWSRCSNARPIDQSRINDLEMHIDHYHRTLRDHRKYGEAISQLAKEAGFGESPFSFNYTKLREPGHLSLYRVILLQLEMDITDALGTARMGVFRNLRNIGLRIEHSLNTIKDFHDEVCIERFKWQLENYNCLQRWTQAAWIEVAKGPREEQQPDTPRYLLSELPLAAAMLAPMLQTTWHVELVGNANINGLLVIMAHLYRALSSAGLITAKWRDMEMLIEAHGAKAFGVREPGDIEPFMAAAKNYGLAFGVSAKDYAKNRQQQAGRSPRVHLPAFRVEQGVVPRDALPLLEHRSWITECLWNSEDEKSYCIGQTRHGNIRHSLHRYVEGLLKDPESTVDVAIREQWQTSRQLTPSQLLSLMQHSLKNMELATNVDYMFLYKGCWDMYNSMLADVEGPVAKSRQKEGLKRSQLARDIVDELLWGAALEKLNGWRDPTLCGLRHLKAFAGPFERWIENNGDLCYQDAIRSTTGNLPDSLVPHKNRQKLPEVRSHGTLIMLNKGQLGFCTFVDSTQMEFVRRAIGDMKAAGMPPSEIRKRLEGMGLSRNPALLMSREQRKQHGLVYEE